MKCIHAVCYQLEQLKKQPEKNSGFNGIRTHDLAIPVQSCNALSTELPSPTDRWLIVIYPMIVKDMNMNIGNHICELRIKRE